MDVVTGGINARNARDHTQTPWAGGGMEGGRGKQRGKGEERKENDGFCLIWNSLSNDKKCHSFIQLYL